MTVPYGSPVPDECPNCGDLTDVPDATESCHGCSGMYCVSCGQQLVAGGYHKADTRRQTRQPGRSLRRELGCKGSATIPVLSG